MQWKSSATKKMNKIPADRRRDFVCFGDPLFIYSMKPVFMDRIVQVFFIFVYETESHGASLVFF